MNDKLTSCVLTGVLVPTIRYEWEMLKTWLSTCPDPGRENGYLFLSIDTHWYQQEKVQLESIFKRSIFASRKWNLVFIDCQMTEDESFYIKDAKVKVDLNDYPFGQKSGPNKQFFESIKKIHSFNSKFGYVLLNEVDAYPIREKWFEILYEKIANLSDLYVIGTRYAGESFLSEAIKEHLNGNAIYRIDGNETTQFYDMWAKILKDSLHIAPHIAYDVVIEWFVFYSQVNPRAKKLRTDIVEDFLRLYVEKKANFNKELINLGGPHENEKDFKLDVLNFIEMYPSALIVHGKCFDGVIEKIRAHYKKSSSNFKYPLNVAIEALKLGDVQVALDLNELTSRVSEKIVFNNPNLLENRRLLLKEMLNNE